MANFRKKWHVFRPRVGGEERGDLGEQGPRQLPLVLRRQGEERGVGA